MLFTDTRDVWFQRDVRNFLHKDELWSRWWLNAQSSTHWRNDWRTAPSLAFVAEEGCQAQHTKNKMWLETCFGRGVTSAKTGLFPGHEHSYCTGTIAGSSRGSLLLLSWMVLIMSNVGQCWTNVEQQMFSLLVHRVLKRSSPQLEGIDIGENMRERRQFVPNITLATEDNLLDRLYAEHFIGGDMMSMVCLSGLDGTDGVPMTDGSLAGT